MPSPVRGGEAGPRSSRGRRWLVVGAGGLLLVSIASFFFVSAAFFDQRITAFVLARLNAELRGELTVEGGYYRPWFGLALEGLVVRDPAGEVVLQAGAITVRVAVLDLLQRRLELELTEIEGVRVAVAWGSDPVLPGVAQAFSPREPGGEPLAVHLVVPEVAAALELSHPAVALACEELLVDGFELTVDDSGLRLALAALVTPGLSFHLTEVALPAASLAVSLGPSEWRHSATGNELHVEGEADNLAADGLAVGVPFAELRFAGRLEDQRIEITTARLSGPEGILSLTGELEVDADGLRHRLSAILEKVKLARIAANRIPADLTPRWVSGNLEIQGDDLASANTEITADVVFPRPARFPEEMPERLAVRGRAKLAPTQIELLGVSLTAADAALWLEGPIRWADRALALTFRFTGDAPQAWLGALRGPVTARRLEATGKVSGTADRPVVLAEARVAGLELPRGPPIDASAHLTLGDGQLRVERGELAAGDARATLAGTVGLLDDSGALLADPPLALATDFSAVELGAFVPANTLRGLARGHATVGGTIRTPEGWAEVIVEPLGVRSLSLAKLEAHGHLDRERLELLAARVSDPRLQELVIEGQLELATGNLTGTLTAAGIDLSTVVRELEVGVPVAGVARATARFSGTTGEPRWEAEAASDEVRLDGVRLGQVAIAGSGDAQSATLQGSTRGPLGEAALRVELGAGLTLASGEGELHSLDLGELLADLWPGVEADGTFTGEFRLGWPTSSPTVDATFTGREVSIGGQPLGDGSWLVVVADQPGGYRVSARSLPSFDAAADVSVDPLRVVGRGTFANIDLAALWPGLFPGHVAFVSSGSIAATFSDQPVDVRVELNKSVLTSAGVEMTLARPTVVTLHGHDVRLGPTVLLGPGASLTVEGEVGDSIDLRAYGKFDPDILMGLLDLPLEFSGPLRLAATASGTRETPVVVGQLEVEEPVEINGEGWPSGFLMRRGVVTLAADGVTLSDLEGDFMGGEVEAGGRVGLRGLLPTAYALRLEGRGLQLTTGDALLEADVRLRLGGEGAAPEVSGEVEILWGRYTRVFALQDFVFARSATPATAPAPPNPWLDGLGLAIRARNVEPMTLEVEAGAISLQLDLISDIDVTGTAGRPRLEGRLEASGGRIRFPAAELEITSGTIDFSPSQGGGVAGVVYLRAEGDVSGGHDSFMVRAILEGPLRHVALALSATPSLEPLAVLSLLGTGRVQLGAGEGDQAQVALGVLGAQLSRPLTHYVQRRLEKALSLDLDLALDSLVTPDGVQIVLGKDLNERLRLEGTYSYGFAAASSDAALRAKLILTDWLVLEGGTLVAVTTAFNNAPRGDLQLRLRVLGD